jgi:hypothetical protein
VFAIHPGERRRLQPAGQLDLSVAASASLGVW